jgi:hypothetical protein
VKPERLSPVLPTAQDPRASFAARELVERGERDVSDLEGSSAGDAAAVGGPPSLSPRDPIEDAADGAAIVRLGLLVWTWLRAKKRAPGAERAKIIDERRQRVDSRAQRMGMRVGPRLGRWLGDGLLLAGILAEGAGEALEDELDELKRETAEQQELPLGEASR